MPTLHRELTSADIELTSAGNRTVNGVQHASGITRFVLHLTSPSSSEVIALDPPHVTSYSIRGVERQVGESWILQISAFDLAGHEKVSNLMSYVYMYLMFNAVYLMFLAIVIVNDRLIFCFRA